MKTPKSEETKRRLTETAFRMFREQGSEKSTMRQIATEAGIALGAAYYYYPSKDHIVQELYKEVTVEHRELAAARLEGVKGLADRLRAALLAGFEVMQPYHEFAADFIGNAISPESGSSPFGEAAEESRANAIAVFDLVLDDSSVKLDAALRQELPEVMWLAYMAGSYFWVQDSSEGQQKTLELINRIAPLAEQLLGVTALPFFKKQLNEVIEIIRLVKS